MSKKRVEYSDTFKAEAIAKIKENNGNISQTAKDLGIPMNTLANWHRKAESGVLAGTQNYSPELIAALDEIKDLKKQLKIAQEERDILKRQRRTLPRTNSQVCLYAGASLKLLCTTHGKVI